MNAPAAAINMASSLRDDRESDYPWCCTQLDTVNVSFLWAIDNFSLHNPVKADKKQVVKSVFFGSDDDKCKWWLRMWAQGIDQESRDCVSLYLVLKAANRPRIRAAFSFFVIDRSGNKVQRMGTTKPCPFVFGKDWGYKKFLKHATLRTLATELLPDDRLTIFCQVRVVGESHNVSGHTALTKLHLSDCDLRDHLGLLYDTPLYSDVSLFCLGGREFSVHRNVLSVRSPVFKEMFDNAEQAAEPIRVSVTDEPQVMDKLLRFLYTGCVGPIDDIALNLLRIADKYKVESLTAICEEVIVKRLTVDTAADALVLAHRLQRDSLRDDIIFYITFHSRRVTSTPGWLQLTESHPDLAATAFIKMAAQESGPPVRRPKRKFDAGV